MDGIAFIVIVFLFVWDWKDVDDDDSVYAVYFYTALERQWLTVV